jgi:hypothetical protein
VHYAGDEGGIMCRLKIPVIENAVYASITTYALIRDCRSPHAETPLTFI